MTTNANPFVEETKPYLSLLLDVARHDLRYHEARDDVPSDELTPEEIVGETLIRASHERSRQPPNVPLRSWLLGMELRVMHQLLDKGARERKRWAVSLDQVIPGPPAPFKDDTYWDWHQSDELLKYEDVLATPPDNRIAAALGTDGEDNLEPTERRAWLLHDVHGLSLKEVAGALHERPAKIRDLVVVARSKLAHPNDSA